MSLLVSTLTSQRSCVSTRSTRRSLLYSLAVVTVARILLRDCCASTVYRQYFIYCHLYPHERDELLHGACAHIDVWVCMCAYGLHA